MIDWNNKLGCRTLERIRAETVIWLTTISPGGVPQPRPVWFVWDGASFLIYSTAGAKKIVHILHNPQVALHFNTNADGEDIQVVLGSAVLDENAPPCHLNAAYCQKYQESIPALGMNVEQYSALFRVAIRIHPVRLRGLDPIPGQ